MAEVSTPGRSVRQKAEPGTPPLHFTSTALRAVLGEVAQQAEGVQDRAAEVLQELLLGIR
jgi:hypothetical protein